MVSNPDGSNPPQEYLAVGAIAVPDQVTRDLLPATSLSELVGDPFSRRMRGDAKPEDLPPAMAHDQQSIEQPERDCRHHEKVHCDNAIRMVAKERLPSLRGRAPPPRHVLGDAGLADVDAELEKFSVDSWRSPQRVDNAHLADQSPDLHRYSRSAAAVPRFPAPIQSETGAVPTDHGVRSDYGKGTP